MSASTHQGASDFARAMGPVARELLGEPNEEHKGKRELRWGTRGSMCVSLDKGTWHNHETAKGGGVLDLIREHKSVDKAGAIAWMQERGHLPKQETANTSAKTIAKTYDYTDADGAVLYQVVRYEPKDFSQRRPNGKGGWLWNMAGIQYVLYRLPDVLAAAVAGRTIYITEGEKAALSLATLGITATCSPGGAGKWRDDYCAALAGAEIVILPDNDKAGQGHATTVDTSLRKAFGPKAKVRTINLPDLPAKGDPFDWVWAGGTLEQLEALAKPADTQIPGLADALSAETWAALDIPPDRRLLGDVVTSGSRVFLVGSTGLGKTLLAYAMAAGMATGQGFLGWRCDAPARVLIIDGEMPSGLIKSRVADVLRRAGPIPHGNLAIYSRDRAEEFARVFPRLGMMEPLNTDAGRAFVLDLVDAIGGVDIVVFDNVMSLIAGDQKDEVPWSEALALVSALTTRGIAQVWLDHTGHNSTRQYGSSTKAWRFDAVGVMTPIEGESGIGSGVTFKLSFEPPGKARRRTPDNWQDFETTTIRLQDDQWTRDMTTAAQSRPKEAKLNDKPALMLRELRDLSIVHGQDVRPEQFGPVLRCIGRGMLRRRLIEVGWFPDDLLRIAPHKDAELTRAGYRPESHALNTLKRNAFIGCNRDWIWLI